MAVQYKDILLYSVRTPTGRRAFTTSMQQIGSHGQRIFFPVRSTQANSLNRKLLYGLEPGQNTLNALGYLVRDPVTGRQFARTVIGQSACCETSGACNTKDRWRCEAGGGAYKDAQQCPENPCTVNYCSMQPRPVLQVTISGMERCIHVGPFSNGYFHLEEFNGNHLLLPTGVCDWKTAAITYHVSECPNDDGCLGGPEDPSVCGGSLCSSGYYRLPRTGIIELRKTPSDWSMVAEFCVRTRSTPDNNDPRGVYDTLSTDPRNECFYHGGPGGVCNGGGGVLNGHVVVTDA